MLRMGHADDRLQSLVDAVRKMLDAEDVVRPRRPFVGNDLRPVLAADPKPQMLGDVEQADS